MKKFRTVDLFCGGGLSQGLQNAGFDIVAAFDWWQPAINFYNQNITGHSASLTDIYKEMQSDKPMTIRDYLGKSIDIVCEV